MTHRDVTSEALRVYEPAEASAILRVTESWLREQAYRRRVRHLLIGGQIRFTGDHLREIADLYERGPEDRPSALPRRRPRPTVQPTPGVVQLTARRPRRSKTA